MSDEGDPRGARRQALPLHRLPEHRRGRAARGGGACGATGRDDAACSASASRGARTPAAAGRGRYTDDFEPACRARAPFVRSDYAHARIARHRRRGALGRRGRPRVYTYEDLDGEFAEPLPLIDPARGASPTGARSTRSRRDEVRYVGETIAMVVARDRYVAEDARGRDRGRVRAAPGGRRHRGRRRRRTRRSCTATWRTTWSAASPRRHGDVDAALAAAAARLRVALRRSSAAPRRRSRRRGVVARFDDARAGCSCTTPRRRRPACASASAVLFELDLEPRPRRRARRRRRLRRQGHPVLSRGGAGPVAARRLGMPVKWTEDRREHFIGSTHERGQIHHVRVGAARRRPHPRAGDELPARHAAPTARTG